MVQFKSDFLNTLNERGFINQCSDLEGVDETARTGKLVSYVGYDATGPSLHVGHLMTIMMLHWLQKTGAGKPLALMGGGTTRIGDPSGRDEARKLLSYDDIEFNKNSLRETFKSFISFGDAEHDALMVDNADWLTKLNYIEMLRDVGCHFSVNRMLSFDSVKMRLERDNELGLSFLEFNYMILQAYDFVELQRQYGCRLQMGGSDQWGNIINGIDLARRMGNMPQLFGLTCPLITTSSGTKMGKTLSGAVWLKAEMRSPYEYWQFWRNTEDADVIRFMKLFTLLPMDEIARLESLQGADINEAKKILATEATTLLHGRDAAEEAAETARKTFEEGTLAENLPTIEISSTLLKDGLNITTVFGPDHANLVSSSSDAKRQIKGGALKVNDETVTDERAQISLKDANPEGIIKLSFGRKKHVLLKVL